jgi:hypothetical protein
MEALIIGPLVVVAFVVASLIGGVDSGPCVNEPPTRAI